MMSPRFFYVAVFGLNMFLLGYSTVAPNPLWEASAIAAVLSAAIVYLDETLP